MKINFLYKLLVFIAIPLLSVIMQSGQTQAQSGVCSFPRNATISSTDKSCDNKDVVIGGGSSEARVTIYGHHEFNNLTIESNGRLTHTALGQGDYDGSSWILSSSGVGKMINLTIANTTTVKRGGSIVVDSKGYLGARTTGSIDCQGHDAQYGLPACDFGDGPGGGVGVDRHNENWAGGSGASYGGFGGFGGDVDGAGSLYYPKLPYSYFGYFNDSGGIYHGSGGGTSRIHEVTPPLLDINGGAGGGAVYLSTGELKGGGKIYANGEDGKSDLKVMTSMGKTRFKGHASGGGSGGLVYIRLTGDTAQSSKFCADTSGGEGMGSETASPTKWGTDGASSVLVNQAADCSSGATNTISIYVKGGNGPYTWLAPPVFNPPYSYSPGYEGTAGSGGGGGRIYVLAQPESPLPVNTLIANLVANPSAGTVPPDLKVTLTGSENNNQPSPFNWQFSCNDSFDDDSIHGELLDSKTAGSPYTPLNKCIYAISGTYFSKVVLSKDTDERGTYTPSHYRARVVVSQVVTPTPKPSVTLSADPASINLGSSSTLSWTSSNATSLLIDNGINGVAIPNGTKVVSPTTTTTYKITATGPGGVATATATVTVIPPTPTPKPTVTLLASPASINLGNSSTLSWTSANVTKLEIDNGIGGVDIPNGTKSVSPTVTTTYKITATGKGGTATAMATVTVIPPTPTPKPTVTLSASPSSINLGNSSTLSWTSANATKLEIDNGIGGVDIPNGTKSVSPTLTTTYKITATGPGGVATATATVTVIENPDQGEISNVIIEKQMYKNDKGTEISTFEPGDKVVVRIRANTNGQENLQGTLTDLRDTNTELPTNITASADKKKLCDLDSTAKMLGGTFSANDGSDNSIWSGISLPLGDGYVCYTYVIKSDAAAKNIVSQANAILREKNTDLILGESNNMMMVRGYPFINSEANQLDSDKTKPPIISPIEDLLSFSSTIASDDLQSGSAKSSASSVSYIYKKGAGAKSRGGTLLSLPTKMIDNSNQDLAYSSFYLMYNPAFYIFGNVFSGNSFVGSSLDLGSRSNAITRKVYDRSNKLNSEASLYNYDFDEDSLIFWDKAQTDKNKAMSESIKELISTPRPAIVCDISKDALSSGSIFLDNPNCNPMADVDSTWSNGRVWYMKANSDVEINATIWRKGTVIVDFGGALGNPTVKVSTSSGASDSFPGDSQLGLIVINGGNVQFTNSCSKFNGIIFVPGSDQAQSSCENGENGSINFEKGGNPIKIRGSIVANCVNFESRNHDNEKYAVTIYSDARLLNSVLPGFENLMSVILGK